MDTRAKIAEILAKGHLMSLGTTDSGGVWVADVIYVYDDDFTLYWMSNPDARHSKALLDNTQVAGSITISNTRNEPNLGIQFSGIAKKIDGPRYDLAKKHLKKRGKPEPREDDEVLQGDSWYALIPTKFDLIDEEQLGFGKESFEL